MKKFLLERKWTGGLILLLFTLIVSYSAAVSASAFLKQIMPTVVSEASQFLPITIENGEIVSPQDALIRRNYGTDQKPIWVVLDTRVDSLNTDDIKDNGFYISRRYMYGVTPQKTEIRDFAKMPNATLDKQMLQAGAQWTEHNSFKYIFITLFLLTFLGSAVVILIYTTLIYLLFGRLMKVDYYRALRVTTLGYIVLLILSEFAMSVGTIMTFILLSAANYIVAKYFPQEKNG